MPITGSSELDATPCIKSQSAGFRYLLATGRVTTSNPSEQQGQPRAVYPLLTQVACLAENPFTAAYHAGKSQLGRAFAALSCHVSSQQQRQLIGALRRPANHEKIKRGHEGKEGVKGGPRTLSTLIDFSSLPTRILTVKGIGLRDAMPFTSLASFAGF